MSEHFDPTGQTAETAPVPESEAMALAREAAAGDGLATGRLLRLLAPRMGTVVRAIMGAHHADSDDVLQVALIGFVQALPAFRGESEPSSYAATIAVRAAVAARKRARKRDIWQDLANAEAVEDVSPGDSMESRLRAELLRDLLQSLPAEQGETLAMRVVLGWSLEEIAAHTRAPFNTVRSRLRLAKEAMKRRIEADPALREALGVDS